MKKLKKIKDWLVNPDAQFEVCDVYEKPLGETKAAIRLSDNAKFIRFYPMQYGESEFSTFYVMNFHDDMKTIDYEIWMLGTERIVGSCEIDDLLLSEDKELVLYICTIDRKR
jgi:hypothetical protein